MNQRELEILNILWSAWNREEKALMAMDIVLAGMHNGLTQSTVTAVLRKLLNQGLIEVDGFTTSGKVLSRTYKPTPDSKEALLSYFTSQYNLFRDIISIDELCTALESSSQTTE